MILLRQKRIEHGALDGNDRFFKLMKPPHSKVGRLSGFCIPMTLIAAGLA
jgi:hypothetical protein